MKPNITDCYTSIEKMAKEIYDLEKKFDYSMKGVFLDMIVTQYVKNNGSDFCMMFDYIMEKQSNNYETYGDIDESIKKLIITGDIGQYSEENDYTATGMYLRDIFSSNNFLIIKVVEKHKRIERFVETEYHVRKVYKEIKGNKIDFKKYVQYGDIRDEGYTVTFVKPKLDREIEVKDNRGMAYKYEKFEQALRAIRNPYNEIKESIV